MEIKTKASRNTRSKPVTASATNSKSAGKRGAPKGSHNAAKLGRDLKYQMYMSKVRRGFFEEYFELKFGRPAFNDNELSDLARQIAEEAITHAMVEEFERVQPGRTTRGVSEAF